MQSFAHVAVYIWFLNTGTTVCIRGFKIVKLMMSYCCFVQLKLRKSQKYSVYNNVNQEKVSNTIYLSWRKTAESFPSFPLDCKRTIDTFPVL